MSCVHISTKNPDDVERIDALLRGMGYQTAVDLAEIDGDVFDFAARVARRRYKLTPREREVLFWLLTGFADEELAENCGVSKATVRWHLRNIEAKLGVEGREAILRRVLHLEEPLWLERPLCQRVALRRMVKAGEAMIAALERQDSYAITTAARALRCALVDGRREARTLDTSPDPQQTGASAPFNPSR